MTNPSNGGVRASEGIGLTVLVMLLSPLRANAGSPGTDLVVPAVARASGQFGAEFYSTIWVTSLSARTPTTVRLFFFLRDTSNVSPATFTDTLGPLETKRYDNAVQSLFGITGSGAVRVLSDGNVLVSSRTYSLPASGRVEDSNGLFFNAIDANEAIASGESTYLQGVTQGGSENFRYNFGMVETTGQSVGVVATLVDGDARQLANKSYILRPYEQKQFSVSDLLPGVATTNAILSFSVVGAGRVVFFGTQIANGSNDSAGFEMLLPYRAFPATCPSSTPLFLSSMSPTRGSCAGGDLVALRGGGFGAEGLSVLFGGHPASVVSASDAEVSVRTPTRILANPQVPEAVDVQITICQQDPSQKTASLPKAFMYYCVDPDRRVFISSVSPSSGLAQGGDTVVLNGGNFGSTTSGLRVMFGGVPATVLSATDLAIRVLTPRHDLPDPTRPDPVDVAVTVDLGLVSQQSAILPSAFQFR